MANHPAEGAKKKAVFTPPTVDEVRQHCQQHGYSIDPESFVAYYEARGWMAGKVKMRSGRAP